MATLLLSVDDVATTKLDATALINGVITLPEFYRQAALDLDASLQVFVAPTQDENGPLLVEVSRSWSTPANVREWPRLGAYQDDSGPGARNVIRSLIPLDPVALSDETLRLLHGTIIGAVKVRHTGTGMGAPLSGATHPLSPAEAGAVLHALAVDGVLTREEDEYRISTHAGITIPFRLDLDGPHPGWAWATTITASIPEQTHHNADNSAGGATWLLGDWHGNGDGRAFRVCLSPAMFAVGALPARQALLDTVLRVVAGHINHALQRSGPTTPGIYDQPSRMHPPMNEATPERDSPPTTRDPQALVTPDEPDVSLDGVAVRKPGPVTLGDRRGVWVHSFKCSICDLEFAVFSWLPDRHGVGSSYCPECGRQTPMLHWLTQTSASPDFRPEGTGTEIFQMSPVADGPMLDDSVPPHEDRYYFDE